MILEIMLKTLYTLVPSNGAKMSFPERPLTFQDKELMRYRECNCDLVIPMIGIAQLDHDHLEIVRLLKNLVDAENPQEFFDFVVHILDYVNHHLEYEEKVMTEIGYPGTRLHTLEHESLRAFIKVYMKPSMKEINDKKDLVQECTCALRFHIIQHDIPLANYILAQQLTFKKEPHD